MFIAVLFVVTKTWKLPKSRINKYIVVYPYKGILSNHNHHSTQNVGASYKHVEKKIHKSIYHIIPLIKRNW